MGKGWIARPDERLLVTGAAGFVGSRVVDSLLRLGFKDIRCFVRPAGGNRLLRAVLEAHPGHRCELLEGNLLAPQDCERAAEGVAVVYHLVAGRGKSFPLCFQGSVITTRNLLEALRRRPTLRRFVNVSSFAVYSNFRLRRGAVWDESCPEEDHLEERFDAYVYGKLRQDEIVRGYHRRYGIPFTIVRPGIVFGPGKKAIPGSVGMDTFGIFMRVGGAGRMPLTYVENCADAIALAGLAPGADGEVFNVMDDDPPGSRVFLAGYKRRVGRFRSIWVPYWLTFAFCWLWERYAAWSAGQLPPVLNRRSCAFSWKGHRYANRKIKDRLGWACRVPMEEALARYYTAQRDD
jgi:nucleoside-diphosphate-sugar epimerase